MSTSFTFCKPTAEDVDMVANRVPIGRVTGTLGSTTSDSRSIGGNGLTIEQIRSDSLIDCTLQQLSRGIIHVSANNREQRAA